MKNECWPDVAFEVSWEVCNKVGGIHTVISTKIPEMDSRLGEQYITIGPDIWREEHQNPEFIEEDSLFKGWHREAAKQGLKISVGRWNIASKPIAIIVDFTPLIARKDEIFSKAWENWKLDSLTGPWDYVEAALFGYASGLVIKSYTDYYRNTKALAHFHEWMTGMGLLYLDEFAPYIGKIFTTHATVMGRSLAGNGYPLYEKLTEFKTDELSTQLGVRAKHSLEKLAAEKADCFTTVSEITGKECEQFLNKKPDIITPNGFNPGFVPDPAEMEIKKVESRSILAKVASAVLGKEIDSDSMFIGTSGRYEFRNKGLDLFIESLSYLNQDPKLKRNIVAFILVPANHYGPRQSVADRLLNKTAEVKGSPYLTHNLHDAQDDSIIKALERLHLTNQSSDRVKVIFIPSYLNGQDGILNLNYYEALMGLDLTLFPSYYEPWGYTPLESLVFGVPTLTTNLAGFGLWLQENFTQQKDQPFFVVDRLHLDSAGIIQLMAEKVEELSEIDPDGLSVLRKKAHILAQSANWSVFFARYEEAYCLAMGKTGLMEIPERELPPSVDETRVVLNRKANDPVWKNVAVESILPVSLAGLNEIARNIWWSWNYKAEALFEEIDHELWASVDNNPIKLLRLVPYTRLLNLVDSENFRTKYDEVLREFKEYQGLKSQATGPQIAYFSMEYGFHSSLKIYSGGLGILAGDYLKEASDRNIKLFGVGLLYRLGYFKQHLTLSGDQISENLREEFSEIPVLPVFDEQNQIMTIQVAFPGRIVHARVWKALIGRVDLYLLDTDCEANNQEDRYITDNLYGGDEEHRLKQEMILGVGGVRMIGNLGIRPDIYHCNEGHSAFIGLERIRRMMEAKLFKFDESLEIVRASTLFTTHTPVPAGHDSFNEDLVRTYMGHYPQRINITWDEFINLGRIQPGNRNEKFSMSYLASNLSQEINAVSKLHGEVTRNMFCNLWKGYYPEEMHIGYVTNGVHYQTWTARDWQELHRKIFGNLFIEEQSDEKHWAGIHEVPDNEIWSIKEVQRERLIAYIKQRLRKNSIRRHEPPNQVMNIVNALNDKTLTIGFARRFATYKRANLLFRDLERLSSIVNNEGREVQFVFAGKAHPRDKAGQDLIKFIIDVSRRPEFSGKIIFLENYDMSVARQLVQGVDVWLNTPTRPLEASGTSGMKAAMNGVMNLSVLDGWWVEGYKEGAGWALPEERIYADQEFQDELDASTIYNLLENELVPLFYTRNQNGIPEKWVSHIKNTFAWVAPNFTTKRMIDDYFSRFYSVLESRSSDMRVNNYHLAREISRWKKRIASSWDQIKVLDIQYSYKLDEPILLGDKYRMQVILDIDGLEPDEIGVELVVVRAHGEGKTEFVYKKEFTQTTRENNHVFYKLKTIPTQPGIFKLGIRIFPKHPKLPHRQDFSYMTWI